MRSGLESIGAAEGFNEEGIVKTLDGSQLIIGELQDNVAGRQTFGAELFLSGEASHASVRAVSYCDLMVLTQSAFEEVRRIGASYHRAQTCHTLLTCHNPSPAAPAEPHCRCGASTPRSPSCSSRSAARQPGRIL